MDLISSDIIVDSMIDMLRGYGLVTPDSERYQRYTAYHKIAFVNLFSRLAGNVMKLTGNLNEYRHDTDKLVLYGILGKKETSKLHKIYSGHHFPNCLRSVESTVHCLIDYECSRFTKADKPENAYEVVCRYNSHKLLKEYLIDMGINSRNRKEFKGIENGLTRELEDIMLLILKFDIDSITSDIDMYGIDKALRLYDESMCWE